ncbi:helix-turn-helix transcriptional regulator [Pantoea ananatis]|uniref:helix-turn-helix transcriptional regulator n=1 Tax=Pantoea ananas TaxID=553 RepID=UPI001B30F1D4|nr:helix-turn-helix transcriptional regulator [Pantoea ananatis]
MVPKRLREARDDAGISQEKLADMLCLEGKNLRSRISSYEVGRTEPPFTLMVSVGKLLDYPESYFYTLDDALAKTLLSIHRNRNDKGFNPYLNTLVQAEEICAELHSILSKAVGK